MAEETLLTAARRVVRFYNTDMNHGGGLITVETQQAVETLSQQVQRETERQNRLAADAAPRLATTTPATGDYQLVCEYQLI